jgi:hypothetical protein
MNIQRYIIILSLVYLIFLNQIDSSSEETSDDNIDLSIFHEYISIIERNSSLRTGYR